MVLSKDGQYLQLNAADRYGLEVLKSEDKWRKKYPNIANKMDDLEQRLHKLENGQKTDK